MGSRPPGAHISAHSRTAGVWWSKPRSKQGLAVHHAPMLCRHRHLVGLLCKSERGHDIPSISCVRCQRGLARLGPPQQRLHQVCPTFIQKGSPTHLLARVAAAGSRCLSFFLAWLCGHNAKSAKRTQMFALNQPVATAASRREVAVLLRLFTQLCFQKLPRLFKTQKLLVQHLETIVRTPPHALAQSLWKI